MKKIQIIFTLCSDLKMLLAPLDVDDVTANYSGSLFSLKDDSKICNSSHTWPFLATYLGLSRFSFGGIERFVTKEIIHTSGLT